MNPKKNFLVYMTVTIMLIALGLQSILSMRQKSPVCDEVSHHIATGYSFLKTRDFRLNSTSPPLTEELAALPLLFLNPVLPLAHPSWENIDRVTFGYEFLFRYNKNASRIVFYSRIPMVMLSMLCALLVFIFAAELYGKRAGLLALFLYVFSPNIIAYSKLVTPDIGVTFFILLAIYRLYKLMKKNKKKNIILAGISLGLALSSKLSALLLLPVFLIIISWKAIEEKRFRAILTIIPVLFLSGVVMFASYFGEVKPLLKNDIDIPEKIEYINKAVDKFCPGNNQQIKKRIIDFAMNVPVPFATYLMNIMAETNMVFVKDYGTFLMGKRSVSGWWYYYPVVFLLKTPIPMLIMLVVLILFFARVKPSNAWGERIGFIFIAGFVAASLLTKLQLSVRYILPIYPLLFVYISKIINLKFKMQKLANICLGLLCVWYACESILIYPDCIAYFNQFAGGADNGWKCLRDSNIDYGQDLPALAKYLEKNKILKVRLSYFGTADPEYYGISYEEPIKIERVEPDNQVYAISINNLDPFEWTKIYNPSAKAGKSIFIYDFRGLKD